MKYQTALGKSIVEYDSDTGAFVWVLAYRKPKLTGALATHKTTNGYLYIKANGKYTSASRLAWQLVYGPIADGLEIDHINRNQTDNRIRNLRMVERRENLKNRILAANQIGVTGVSLHRQSGLFRARYRNKTAYAKTVVEAAQLYADMKHYDT